MTKLFMLFLASVFLMSCGSVGKAHTCDPKDKDAIIKYRTECVGSGFNTLSYCIYSSKRIYCEEVEPHERDATPQG